MLRFDDQVVIITGGGGALGRAYCSLFSSRGAKLVVNDLNKEGADAVVAEIKKNGGEAVADYNSVEYGDKIVETAVNTYGTVHILINNGGILRDKSFKNMTDEAWDQIYKVHVYGTYKLSKAAFPIFRQQKFGRIINTGSHAGVFGNFGQSNYSSAKGGKFI